MNDTVWLLVGREVDGRQVKGLYMLSNKGERQRIRYSSFATFSRDNKVINAHCVGGNPNGIGISLTSLPTYVKDNQFGIIQKGGISEQEVIKLAQPYINEYFTKQQNRQDKKDAQQNEEKNKKIEYVYSRLEKYNYIIDELIKAKDLTNLHIQDNQLTRYLKQLDIDNSENESLQKIIQRTGVNGAAKEIKERVKKISKRATEYNIRQEKINNSTVESLISYLIDKCNRAEELHKESRKLVKDNRNVVDQVKKVEQIIKSEIETGDAIEIDVNNTNDMVELPQDGDIEIGVQQEGDIELSLDSDEVQKLKEAERKNHTAGIIGDKHDFDNVDDIENKKFTTEELLQSFRDIVSEDFKQSDGGTRQGHGYKTWKAPIRANYDNVEIILKISVLKDTMHIRVETYANGDRQRLSFDATHGDFILKKKKSIYMAYFNIRMWVEANSDDLEQLDNAIARKKQEKEYKKELKDTEKIYRDRLDKLENLNLRQYKGKISAMEDSNEVVLGYNDIIDILIRIKQQYIQKYKNMLDPTENIINTSATNEQIAEALARFDDI